MAKTIIAHGRTFVRYAASELKSGVADVEYNARPQSMAVRGKQRRASYDSNHRCDDNKSWKNSKWAAKQYKRHER